MQSANGLVKSSFLPDNNHYYQIDKTGFKGVVEIYGKPVRVAVTAKACKQLTQLKSPVLAEMELYFSCLIRKRVLFSRFADTSTLDDNVAEALPGLYISFNPVTTKECRIVDHPNGPLLKAMPIREPGRFVPDWINIHHRSGHWTGEYGFKTHA